MREVKRSSVYVRIEDISGVLDWSCTETVCRKKGARDEAPGMSGAWDWALEEKVYYESRKRELKRRLINEGRCDGDAKGDLRRGASNVFLFFFLSSWRCHVFASSLLFKALVAKHIIKALSSNPKP